tara:strand:+ start:518 stop:685 length:168 start_codon:yes stop_codon:yes gene_type:complete
MEKEHTSNPYHIDEQIQNEQEKVEEKTMNHVFHVLDEILGELKSINRKIDKLEKD